MPGLIFFVSNSVSHQSAPLSKGCSVSRLTYSAPPPFSDAQNGTYVDNCPSNAACCNYKADIDKNFPPKTFTAQNFVKGEGSRRIASRRPADETALFFPLHPSHPAPPAPAQQAWARLRASPSRPCLT